MRFIGRHLPDGQFRKRWRRWRPALDSTRLGIRSGYRRLLCRWLGGRPRAGLRRPVFASRCRRRRCPLALQLSQEKNAHDRDDE